MGQNNYVCPQQSLLLYLLAYPDVTLCHAYWVSYAPKIQQLARPEPFQEELIPFSEELDK